MTLAPRLESPAAEEQPSLLCLLLSDEENEAFHHVP